MFSGWGMRTYAPGQPGYNPIGYHAGTVWPHDASLIAAGLKRYGFDDEANRLVGRVFEARAALPRLPPARAVLRLRSRRLADPRPVPVACSPQAWAAGAIFLFLETMLGLRPHAAAGELELTARTCRSGWARSPSTQLRVGEAEVDLLFHRWRGGTSAEVLRKIHDLSVTIRI